MEQTPIVELPHANAVLRGGPRAGVFAQVNLLAPIVLPHGDRMCHYQPTAEQDGEHPQLRVYRFSHYVDEVRGDTALPEP